MDGSIYQTFNTFSPAFLTVPTYDDYNLLRPLNIVAVPLYQGSCREIPWWATSYDLYLVICRFDTLLCVNDSMWHVDDILCLLLQGHILSVTYALNITA